jgi:hypothetical protein
MQQSRGKPEGGLQYDVFFNVVAKFIWLTIFSNIA